MYTCTVSPPQHLPCQNLRVRGPRVVWERLHGFSAVSIPSKNNYPRRFNLLYTNLKDICTILVIYFSFFTWLMQTSISLLKTSQYQKPNLKGKMGNRWFLGEKRCMDTWGAHQVLLNTLLTCPWHQAGRGRGSVPAYTSLTIVNDRVSSAQRTRTEQIQPAYNPLCRYTLEILRGTGLKNQWGRLPPKACVWLARAQFFLETLPRTPDMVMRQATTSECEVPAWQMVKYIQDKRGRWDYI